MVRPRSEATFVAAAVLKLVVTEQSEALLMSRRVL